MQMFLAAYSLVWYFTLARVKQLIIFWLETISTNPVGTLTYRQLTESQSVMAMVLFLMLKARLTHPKSIENLTLRHEKVN
jgi:hypothetical protein